MRFIRLTAIILVAAATGNVPYRTVTLLYAQALYCTQYISCINYLEDIYIPLCRATLFAFLFYAIIGCHLLYSLNKRNPWIISKYRLPIWFTEYGWSCEIFKESGPGTGQDARGGTGCSGDRSPWLPAESFIWFSSQIWSESKMGSAIVTSMFLSTLNLCCVLSREIVYQICVTCCVLIPEYGRHWCHSVIESPFLPSLPFP